MVKKILSYVAIASLGIAIVMLITAIFGVEIFDGVGFKFLISFVIIAAGCGFSLNAVSLYKKNQTISIVSLALLGVSSLMGILCFWFDMGLFINRITGVISIISVLFISIINNVLRLANKYLILQIVTYALIVIIDISLTLLIFGLSVFEVEILWQLFIAVCLVAFALNCTLSIMAKKNINETASEEKEKIKTIKISEEEYNQMKQKIEELEKELSLLKGETK